MTRNMPHSTAADLVTRFARTGSGGFSGYVVASAEPQRQFTVELEIDGVTIATAHASRFVPELAARRIGDGCYGFVIQVPDASLYDAERAVLRLANIGTTIGSIDLTQAPPPPRSSVPVTLRWLGGVRFCGSIADHIEAPSNLVAVVDGHPVQRIEQFGWGTLDAHTEVVRTFDLHLPHRFADGCIHRVSIQSATGDTLCDREIAFVAFPDGLTQTLASLGQIDSERLRGKLFDQLIPMSLPMMDYEKWFARFPLHEIPSSSLQCAVILVGDDPTDVSFGSLEQQIHQSWTGACLDNERSPGTFNPKLVEDFLAKDAASAPIVVFALAGTAFNPNALSRLARTFDQDPDILAVYPDVDVQGPDGRLWPLAFPAFDYERLLEQGYCAHLFAMRREIVEQLFKKRPSSLYRLFNSLLDKDLSCLPHIVHLPGSAATIPSFDRAEAAKSLGAATLEHLTANGSQATIGRIGGTVFPAIAVRRASSSCRTTVIIPTRDRVDLLAKCLDSIRPAVNQHGAEILIVDNESSDTETLNYLERVKKNGTTVLRIEGAFNFARLNNIAVERVKTENVLLLNNDVEATDDRWLDELTSRLAGPDVGAVGALLIWPSGIVQHGGIVLGPNFDAAHAFNDRRADESGYTDLLSVAHECSAVTAACLLTRTADYVAAGGMDETCFAIAYNDVDYCLKLRARGRRIVFTPHAKLIHRESISRGTDRKRDTAGRFHREREWLRAKWGGVLAADPYYNPSLALDTYPYSALAWPPRDRSGRRQTRPMPTEQPQGF